jgi:glycosyltransferase involved in cell wall biosynthesis
MNIPVTIILPTLNERSYIRDCLDSLNSQDYPKIIEILVIDGGSTDGTQNIVLAEGGKTRLLHNPRMTAASAMNIGINHSKTQVFVRVDAHTLYASNYVSQSIKTYLSTGATVVGGPMRPVGENPFGRAVAAVTTSPLGIGPGRFHYSNALEEVDTVYLGVFNQDFVKSVGGYDEENLQWAAEDQELNFRISQAGGRIILDPEIRSTYFPRNTAKSLARQYHNYGMCKASTLAKHKSLPHWRPIIPAAMILGVFFWMIGSIWAGYFWITLLPILIYFFIALFIGIRMSKEKGVTPHRVAIAITICHWCYGAGMWRGLGRIISFRRFDSRPRGGRR